MRKRGSGILLHITSLPSMYGIGDMGPQAHRFADFLSETGQRFWQILPLNPTDPIHGNSPYHSASAFACNPLLISPEILVNDGWLYGEDLDPLPDFSNDQVDFSSVIIYKRGLFQKSYELFKKMEDLRNFEVFCYQQEYWLEDFALFTALKNYFSGKVWTQWPKELRNREPATLESAKKDFKDEIEKEKFFQYLFHQQWRKLKEYCNERNIQIIGDIPIYVVFDSADVWTHPELFNLDSEKNPLTIAGVPPDYFSETGQLWGNPVYKWDRLKDTGYEWWIKRISHNLNLFDYIRIDHFRGFVGYWEVPASEKTAINGKWKKAPAKDFFNTVLKKIPDTPIIAEDLGIITPDIVEIMDHFEFPGMKVLLFAFGDDTATNPYAPHNHVRNCLVYTGTHDNNTARGWFEREAGPEIRNRLFKYLGRKLTREEFPWELIRLAMMSVADTVICPMQDVLGLGEESRMNRPATKRGNWNWRLNREQITPDIKNRLSEMTKTYGRA